MLLKFLILMLVITMSMQLVALTCEPDYDCSLALSGCVGAMDNRYCGGGVSSGKCSCREGLASSHAYLGLPGYVKVVEMYYLDSGIALAYYAYACNELPCGGEDCNFPLVEFDGSCQCDRSNGYLEAEVLTVEQKPSSTGCGFLCSHSGNPFSSDALVSENFSTCENFCEANGGNFTFGDLTPCVFPESEYPFPENCNANMGHIVVDGICLCDESKGYASSGKFFNDGLIPDCQKITCSVGEFFRDNKCLKHCSDFSSDISCSCYETQNKYTVNLEKGSFSACSESSESSDSDSDSKSSDSKEHCSISPFSKDCTCQNLDNKHSIVYSDKGQTYSKYYCQGEIPGGEGGSGEQNCGSALSGTYSLGDDANSCSCSTEKVFGVIGDSSIAYCSNKSNSDSSSNSGSDISGNWATESTAVSIESKVSDINSKTSDIVSNLEAIENSLNNSDSSVVSPGQISAPPVPSAPDTSSLKNIFGNSEVQKELQDFKTFLDDKILEFQEALGMDSVDLLPSTTSGELPCFHFVVGDSSDEFCLSEFSNALNLIGTVFMFFSTLLSFRIILGK